MIPESLNDVDEIKEKSPLKNTTNKLTAYGGTRVPIKGKCMQFENRTELKLRVHGWIINIVQATNAKPLIGLHKLFLIFVLYEGFEAFENDKDLIKVKYSFNSKNQNDFDNMPEEKNLGQALGGKAFRLTETPQVVLTRLRQ